MKNRENRLLTDSLRKKSTNIRNVAGFYLKEVYRDTTIVFLFYFIFWQQVFFFTKLMDLHLEKKIRWSDARYKGEKNDLTVKLKSRFSKWLN